MIKVVLAIGAIMILIALLLIYRIFTLLKVAKESGKPKSLADSSNTFNALMLGFVISSLLALTAWFSFAYYDEYTLPVASEHGVLIDNMFWLTTYITLAVMVITHILMFVFAYIYRYKKTNTATFFPHNNFLEMVWTIAPAIVLTLLVVSGLRTWNDVMAKSPDNAENIEIMGYQFAWKARYPGKSGKLGAFDYRLIDEENIFGLDFSDKDAFDDFSPREIHIPKGRYVHLHIRARDVIHSVFAPHFRLKMDAVPGMPTRFGFVATKTTEEMRKETNNPEFDYEIACTEICGRGHFSMRMKVVVEEPEDYDKWYSAQKSWLSKHPDYVAKIPEKLKEVALIQLESESEDKQ